MKFIHIADVHLGAEPDKGRPWSKQRAQELWQTFRRLIGTVDQERADLLLIAGDLFHRQPQYRELREVNYLFGTLKRTQVVLIAGNHDYLHRDSLYRGFEWEKNVFFLGAEECERVCFGGLNTSVYGFSYHQKEIPEPLYDRLEPDKEPGCHILLAHGGDESHIPIDKRRLAASGFDYIALGHIHKPQSLAADKMIYAGALEPIDPNDTGKHGYIVGEYRAGKIRTRFVPFACREYIHLNLQSTGSSTDFSLQEQLAREIAARGSEHIYKVEITGFRDERIRYRTEDYLALGNVAGITDLTEPDFNFEELLRVHRDDVVGRYIEKLLQDDPQPDSRSVRMRALRLGLQCLYSRGR